MSDPSEVEPVGVLALVREWAGLYRDLFRAELSLRCVDALLFLYVHVFILGPAVAAVLETLSLRAAAAVCAAWAALIYPLAFAKERDHSLLEHSLGTYAGSRARALGLSSITLICLPLLLVLGLVRGVTRKSR